MAPAAKSAAVLYAALLLAALPTTNSAPFTPGNIVVSRVGDGVTTLAQNCAAVFLDELTPAGVLVQSISLPANGGASLTQPNGFTLPGQNPLICQAVSLVGNSRTAGLLTRSQNGKWLSFMGTVSPLGSSFSSAVISWAVALVNTNGTIDTTTAPLQRHGGDTFFSAVTVDGNEFWWACSGSGTSGAFTIGYSAPLGTQGSYPGTYTSGTSAAINVDIGSAFIDVNPFSGNLVFSAQVSAPTGGSTAVSLSTDLYQTTGTPVAGSPTWTALGLGAVLHAPRGFAFLSSSILFVADYGYGVRRFTMAGASWTADPVTYIANAFDTSLQQVAVGADGVTLFAVTPQALYGFNTTSLTWLKSGASLRPAGGNAQFRGVAQVPYIPIPPNPAVSELIF